MDLSQAFLEHLGIHERGWIPPVDYPGDTCSQGHPFGEGADCVNCPPDRDLVEDAADFRTLVDHVIAKLNPDGFFALDRVEVSICMDAITAMTDHVESLRCMCGPLLMTCGRCRALGRHRDEKVQR